MEHLKRFLSRIAPWSQALTGLLLSVAIVHAALCGEFRPQYRLHTFFSAADGLLTGAAVRLDGVQVGRLDRIAQAKANSAAASVQDIIVTLRIDTRYQPFIRADSGAVMASEGLLGARYIRITRGFTGDPLVAGEELKSVPTRRLNSDEAARLIDAMKQSIKMKLNPQAK
jgi:ABC-type transporter Mla subunit MlaD